MVALRELFHEHYLKLMIKHFNIQLLMQNSSNPGEV